MLSICMAAFVSSPRHSATRYQFDGTGELTTKVAGGAGGYELGDVIKNTSRALTQEKNTEVSRRSRTH